MNQDRAVVVSKLRDVYFRRGAGSALVMWVALWPVWRILKWMKGEPK